MLKDVQTGMAEDVFKCVTCGHTTPARTVDGTGPLDIEQHADDMYRDAVGMLRQQVCGPVPQPNAFTALANTLTLPAENCFHVYNKSFASLATGSTVCACCTLDSGTMVGTACSALQNNLIMVGHNMRAR